MLRFLLVTGVVLLGLFIKTLNYVFPCLGCVLALSLDKEEQCSKESLIPKSQPPVQSAALSWKQHCFLFYTLLFSVLEQPYLCPVLENKLCADVI